MVAMLTTLFLFILLESLITLILNIKNKRSLKRPLITLISSLILIFSFAQFGPDEPTTKTEPKADHIVYKPAKSDQKEYVAAKTKKAALIATLAKLKNENAELKSAKNDGDQKVKKQEQQKKEAESKRLAQKAEEASAKEAAEKQAKQAASQSKKVASSQSRAIASSAREQSKQAASSSASDSGDTYTGNAQSIIGNANSKIYHVPGQSGYHMNSSNAVYFKSEADAQAHGYRKALR